MVASLGDDSGVTKPSDPVDSKNRVLKVLMRRLGSSRTFGENMIFMLNRASTLVWTFTGTRLILLRTNVGRLLHATFDSQNSISSFHN